MRVGYVLSCGHGLLGFSVHSLLIRVCTYLRVYNLKSRDGHHWGWVGARICLLIMANIFHNWQRMRLQLAKTRTHQTVIPAQGKPQTATSHASVSSVKTSAISLLRCPTTSNSKITMTLNTSFLNSHPWSNQTVHQFCNCSSVPCIFLHAKCQISGETIHKKKPTQESKCSLHWWIPAVLNHCEFFCVCCTFHRAL